VWTTLSFSEVVIKHTTKTRHRGATDGRGRAGRGSFVFLVETESAEKECCITHADTDASVKTAQHFQSDILALYDQRRSDRCLTDVPTHGLARGG
jgi:hypothetical protein